MEQRRDVETRKGSFFRDCVYDQIISADHFLCKLNAVIEWTGYTSQLIRLYKGEGLVRWLPFQPALVLMRELLTYLYSLGQRQVERQLNKNLSATKQGHRLGTCRYLGKIGFAVQAFLTAMALNLKRLVKLLSGRGFKSSTAVV